MVGDARATRTMTLAWPLAVVGVVAISCSSARVRPPSGEPDDESPAASASADASSASNDVSVNPTASGGAGDAGGLPAPGSSPGKQCECTNTPAASESASATPVPTPSAVSSAPAGRPVAIEILDPTFTSGEVKTAKASIEKLTKKLSACVDDNGGLSSDSGHVVVQFLVRASGVAEGVDVLEAKGVTSAAKKCVRELVQKRPIGAPSSDPVGVQIKLKLSPRS